MKTGSVPVAWIREFGMSAEFNLRLLDAVTRAGIDPHDLDRVRPVAAELKEEQRK